MTPVLPSLPVIAPSAPSAQPNAQPAAAQRNHDFAQMLERRQAQAALEARQAQARPRESDSRKRAPEAVLEEPANLAATPKAATDNQAADAQAASKPAAQSRSTDKADKADKNGADKADTEGRKEADKGTELVPGLADWLAALNWPQAPATPTPTGLPVGQAHGADEDGADAGAALKADGPRALTNATEQQRQRHLQRAEQEVPTTAESARQAVGEESVRDALPDGLPMVEADSHRPVASIERKSTLTSSIDATHALGGAGAADRATAAPTADAASNVTVPTPVDSPDFPQVLGLQISVLARDGVQQAELHLNPAEMGPISVQIALDGNQAKVDFSADSAVTRQIIEGGLPELASALSDAGFTLSGGGVFQHSQGQRQDETGSDRREGGNRGQASDAPLAGVDAGGVRRSNARIAAGGVDLYA